jgi:threonine dehydratase
MNIDMIRAARERLDGHQAHAFAQLRRFSMRSPAGGSGSSPNACSTPAASSSAAAGPASPPWIRKPRKRGVIAFSSGNHAQGVALAAARHGAPAVIIMPSDAPRMKIDNTRALGAEVVLYDRANEDRDAIGARLAEERGLTLIKPYDEPEVIAGQGTCGLEIAEQAAEKTSPRPMFWSVAVAAASPPA